MVQNKCIMKQTSGNCAALLLQAKSLEKKFLASLTAKGVLDASVCNTCSNIRHLYKSIILTDPAFAEVQNVEHFLWQLHYRQIETFRYHVCSDKDWVMARDSSARTASKQKWRELLQSKPILAGFRSFLIEASGFYHELMLKLKVNFGSAPNWESQQRQKSNAVNFSSCQQSCYRCLLNLGDYARYKEFYVGDNPFNYDFSIAADFYREAIAHWPVGGQPHNQLAVLAVYLEDDLLAVYHYFRSLAVEKPFPTTRENLTILFEKNRMKYEGLPSSLVKLTVPSSIRKIREKVKPSQIIKSTQKTPMKKTLRELVDQFFVRFVRLNGLFFTKTSLEKFEEVHAGVLHDLQQLLALDDRNMELALGSSIYFGMPGGLRGPFGVLKLVVILICTLENVMCGSTKHRETTMQTVLYQNAFKALLSIVGQFMQRCAETHHASHSFLLPSMLVFFEWLTCKPDIVCGVDKDDEQFNLLSFIWKQFMRLLNRVHNEETVKIAMRVSGENPEVGIALWEDFELQGFLPMSSAHDALLNGERSKLKDPDIIKDGILRWCRLVASGYALANIAERSSLSVIFSKFTAKLRSLEENCVMGMSETILCRQVTQIKEQVGNNNDRQACRYEDDDEEELIVFQPAAKEQLLLSTSSAIAEPLSNTVSVHQNASSSCMPVLTFAPSSCVSELHNSPNPDCLPNPSSLYAADTIRFAALNSHSLSPRKTTASVTQVKESNNLDMKLNRQASPPMLNQPSRTHPMRSSINPINVFESESCQEFRKLPKSLGVIGQPKQTHISMQSTVKCSNGLPNDTIQLNHTVKQQSPSLSFKANLTTKSQGNSSAGISSMLVESTSRQSSCYTGVLVIGPPPGFGPRPTKLPMNLRWNHIHEEKGVPQNYLLAKESKCSNLTPFLAEDHITSPVCSVGSVVNNKALQSENEIQSAESAVPSLSQPGSTAGQQSIEIVSEKKTWSLFGPVAGYNWTPTMIS